MQQDLPIQYDLVFSTAVEFLSSSYRRNIHELTESKNHPTFGERSTKAIDILSDFFNQIKLDATLLTISNADDIVKLSEAYYTNKDYETLIRNKTFEFTSMMGIERMKYLANHYSHSFALTKSSSTGGTMASSDIAQALTENPWLIMVLTSIFTRVTDGAV